MFRADNVRGGSIQRIPLGMLNGVFHDRATGVSSDLLVPPRPLVLRPTLLGRHSQTFSAKILWLPQAALLGA